VRFVGIAAQYPLILDCVSLRAGHGVVEKKESLFMLPIV
jgi:hypothetical protein